MRAYLARRLLYAVLTFFGITLATFTLIHSVPGDPIVFFIGRAGTRSIPPATLAAIRAEYHLDQPLPAQYLHWLRGAVTLDFGRSIVTRRPVRERIFDKLPNTFELNSIAFLLAAAIGIPIGLWSASRSGHLAERASAVIFFLLYSLPAFWVALLLMQFFSVRLQVLPLFGMFSDDYEYLSASARLADRLRHLVLPVITLTYAQLAIFVRFSKSALTEVIRQDFITAARAKGAGNAKVMWHHAFRNALMPMITLLGLAIPYLISGSVIVEQMFQWDGVGLLYIDAILQRDYPTVMGLTVVTAVVTLLAGLLADILYAFADPRVRLGEGVQ
jgi:peptide/nickel transport system permease protein